MLPFPSTGDLPELGIEPRSLALQGYILWLSHQGSLEPVKSLGFTKLSPSCFELKPENEVQFSTWLARSIHRRWRRKWQPTLVFLPGESQGQRSLEGHGVGHNWSDFAAAAAAYTGGKKNTSQHTISCHRFSEILIQAWSLPLINYLFLLFNVGGFQGGEFSNLLTL